MLSGAVTRANLDNLCKQHARIARSSGDAESRGISDTICALLDTADDTTGVTHAVSFSVANKAVPLLETLENLGFKISEKLIFVDAAVALSSVCKGHCKIMQYLSKTPGVDLGLLSETIEDLGFPLEKAASNANCSDILTTGVSADVLEKLLQLLGMSQGVTR